MIYKEELGLDLYKTVLAVETTFQEQEDLFFCESILVSTGENKNDDVFLKEETWNARNTPVDKYFNFMHDETKIIGHIVSSKVVSNDVVIPDNTIITDVPENFNIVVGSVIYRKFNDRVVQDRINKLIAEIQEGLWYVSMECWHKSFDYLLSKNDESIIVPRNKNTAFLTKHLRLFKGDGQYQGYKVSRVLKDFYFSGKGLVNKPANKSSIIIGYSQEKTMSYTEAQYKALEDRLAIAEKVAKEVADKAVATEIDSYKSEIKKLQDSLKDSQDKTTATINDLTNELKSIKDKLVVTEEIVKNKTEQCSSLEKAKAELEVKYNEQAEVIKKAEVEKAKAGRIAKFNDVEISEDNAKALVEQFISVSDEVFDNLVKSFPKKKTKVEASVIDDFEPVENATLTLAHVEGANELRSKTSEWLKSSFTKKNKK